MWKIVVICLLFITPVRPFPRPENAHSKDQSETSTKQIKQITHLETLNSKAIGVNAQNDIEKPVLNSTAASNIESENSVTDAPIGATKSSSSSSSSSRQLNVPFMAVPANWVATFEPSNAVILAQKVPPLRIWAIGSVSKFPSFFEKIIQRIQSYYSTYKYHDLSRPASLAIINPQYHLHDNVNSGNTQIEVIEHDVIDDDTEPAIDYSDTTTELSFIDENDNDNDDDNDFSDDETTESDTNYTNYQSDETATK